MKRTVLITLIFGLLAFAIACSNDGAKERKKEQATDLAKVELQQPEVHGTEIKEVKLTHPLDQTMIASGKGIYDLKCGACHKLTADKLVGPGWKDVTKRRQPVWIMNMITNVDMMLEKDPEAQKLLEQCLVRMPNQNLSEKEARDMVEFMRKNDGEK